MKRGDHVELSINGYTVRAVVRKVHRDATATIDALSGSPLMGKFLRVPIIALVKLHYPEMERAFEMDRQRYGSKG